MRSTWFPVYRLLAGASAPLACYRLSRANGPDWQHRQLERKGWVPASGGELWLHAASVGELNAAEGLLRHWLAADAQRRIVVSTHTATAAAEVAARFLDQPRVRHVFAPVDAMRFVRRWLDKTRPAGLVLVETEIWPVLLDQCRKRGLPVALVNARISQRAFGRYRRFATLFGRALQHVAPVLCQTEQDMQRFLDLGVAPERLRTTGNLKFDRGPVQPPERSASSGAERPVWIAGSTHEGEEAMIATAHRTLVQYYSDALLVLVPRHPERASRALETVRRIGLSAEIADPQSAAAGLQTVVVDRMGALAGLYASGKVCFVGGSLVEGVGGHNLLEPALAGKPVLTGPHVSDQQPAAEGLKAAGGLLIVNDQAQLAVTVRELFDDPQHAARVGAAARQFADRKAGALQATCAAMQTWLEYTETAAVDDRARVSSLNES